MIEGIGAATQVGLVTEAKRPSAAGFSNLLGDALGRLQDLEGKADSLSIQLATGQPVDLHEAVIASEEANLGFQFAMQVRNKVVEAYQEIMRMQV